MPPGRAGVPCYRDTIISLMGGPDGSYDGRIEDEGYLGDDNDY